jgi:fructokinase/N-acetylglucosamine kinase
MKNCNSTCLNGRPLQEDLERALNREVRLANDADCFALSEAVDGAAAGAETVFGVILGTGVGGGVVVRGHVLNGANAIGGEWGHSPLPYFQFARAQADRSGTGQHPATGEAILHPWPSPRELDAAPACYCGKKGCIETWLSGPALAADHVRYGGEDLPAHEIVQLANAGYGPCSTTLARYEERLARALASVINLLDPEVIVLGGGLTRPLVRHRAPAVAALRGFSDHATPGWYRRNTAIPAGCVARRGCGAWLLPIDRLYHHGLLLAGGTISGRLRTGAGQTG